MGTYAGGYRLAHLVDDDLERDEEIVGGDLEKEVDLIEDILGEFPNVWEAMLTGMPRGGRKRERYLATHAGGT